MLGDTPLSSFLAQTTQLTPGVLPPHTQDLSSATLNLTELPVPSPSSSLVSLHSFAAQIPLEHATQWHLCHSLCPRCEEILGKQVIFYGSYLGEHRLTGRLPMGAG